VLLSDFGISKAIDAATATATTVSVGTPAYMSPEQCTGQAPDGRTDVYSLGVVVYEMLAGRRPFVGDLAPETITNTTERIRWEQMHASPPALRKLNPAVPREVEAAVMTALAKDREARWPTVAAFGEALERVWESGSVGVWGGGRAGASERGSAPLAEARVIMPPRPVVRPAPQEARPAARSFDPRDVPWPIWAVGGGLVVVLVLVAALALSRGGGRVTPTAPVVAQAVTKSIPTPTQTRVPGGIPPPIASSTLAPTRTPPPSLTPTATATVTSVPTLTATPTSTPKPAFTVKVNLVNVRSGPGMAYPIVGVLHQGETSEITGKNAAGDWWQFTFSGQPAWISDSVVNANNQAVSASVVAAPTLAPQANVPILLEPAPNTTAEGVIEFKWQPVSSLPAGAAYEVVWWGQDESPASARGVAPAVLDTSLRIYVSVMVDRPRRVYWTVLVVNTSPYQRLTQPADNEARPLSICRRDCETHPETDPSTGETRQVTRCAQRCP
jgi:serine/threonine-protein kinase